MRLEDIKDPILLRRINDALGGEVGPDSAPVTGQRARPSDDPESALHDKVEEYCRAHGLYYLHSRMDRRTTIQVGATDFVIALPQGHVLWLELKRRGGKATPKQLATMAHLLKLGHYVAMVDNWTDALRLLEGPP